ncbi:MAG: flagellar basal body-associated FliL family protein [Gammaproteobacteria bacterium]|nr:flagellar basal body-associated FliL family protein [Gammaproteobacteria bacterium]
MPAFPEQAPPDLSAFDDPKATPPPAPRKSRRKLIIGLAVGLPLLAALGGGAAWWFLREPSAEEPPGAQREEAKAETEAGTKKKETAKDKKDKKGKNDKKAEPKGEPIYLALAPAFVVNLSDEEALRYLQVEAEVLSRDPATVEEIKKNMPAIRNNMLLLLGTKRYHELLTRADKEKLQGEMLAEIRKVVQDDPKEPRIEAIFFTNFVTQ